MPAPFPRPVDEGILDRAAALFAQQGVAKTSVQDVADAVGLSKAGLLHHVPTKDALHQAVLEHAAVLGRSVLDAVGEMLAHPFSVPGLSDGGAHVGTICDASFPTTLLAYWGRDRDHGRMPLPFLVQRHTRDTARTVGLRDRGVLAPGYVGDANIIDFDRLALHRPVKVADLPGGASRLIQRADGYVATIKGGTVTFENGEHTGATPGALLRGAR